MSSDVLVGRVSERAAIDELIRRARSGQGQALVVHGEPGIGKTALLGHAAEASDGMRLLRSGGVQPEADIGYASLHRMLAPVSGVVHQIPEPQAAALEVALGQAEGPTPDRFLVSLAVLSLLAEVATASPVLCLVDDAQWVDGPSLDALAFVARRLDDEPLGIVFAVRADDATHRRLVGVPELPVSVLDQQAATELLDRHHPHRLTQAQRHEVIALAAGNPLALKELPHALLDGYRAQHPEPVPLTAGLQDAFLDQIRQRDPVTQQLLLLIAADGSGRRETVRAAAAALGLGVDDVDGDQLDDQIVDDGERLELRHPLVRAAVYHGASPAERRAAHRALAAALADDPVELHRHAWHLGQAADERDEATAALLERSAQQASRRAGHGAAAAALRRAAELSDSDEQRARRVVAAATLSWQGGEVDRARDLLAEAERAERIPDDAHLELAELRARLELLVGTPADGVAPLRAVMPQAMARDPRRAMPLLMTYGEIGYRTNRPEAWVEIDGWLDDVPLDGDTPADALYRLVRGGSRVRLGKSPRDGRPRSVCPSAAPTCAFPTNTTPDAWRRPAPWQRPMHHEWVAGR